MAPTQKQKFWQAFSKAAYLFSRIYRISRFYRIFASSAYCRRRLGYYSQAAFLRPAHGTAKGGTVIKKLKFLLIGAAAGVLNGLFGAGGGMLVVPMLRRTGCSTAQAHATSIAIMLPLSVVSGLLYLSHDHFELAAATPFLLPGLIGAALGAVLLPRVKSVWLHRIFGVLVLFCGARLLLQ